MSTNRKTLGRDLSRLVARRSVTTCGNLAIARDVASRLRRAGFRIRLQKRKIGKEVFANVVGLKGPKGRPLLLASHLDTVPPGELEMWSGTGGDPFRAKTKENRLFGLGSADAKGPLLAMMHAALAGSQGKLSRPLMFLATFGEESGMKGAQWFTRAWQGKKPCAALVGEPTSLGITYRHKGLGVLVVELRPRTKFGRAIGTRERVLTFSGKQGHSSRPALGENALEKALAYLAAMIRKDPRFEVISLEGGSAANLIPGRASLRLVKIPAAAKETRVSREPRFPLEAVLETCAGVKKIVRRMARRKDSSFAPETITSNWGIATTEGGCVRLVFDFRLLPGQSIEEISRRLKGDLAVRLQHLPGMASKVTIERKNPPLGLKRSHRLPRFVASVLRRRGIPPRLETKPSCTEAGVYAAWGVPSVVFGPGKAAGNIHAPNESVSLAEIAKAVEVYAAVIESVCVKGESCT